MELTRIGRLLVPAAWTLVVTQLLLQIALVLPVLAGRGIAFDAGPAWLSALLALVVGLAVGWADAGRRARPVAVAALVVSVTGTMVLLALGALSLAVVLGVATTPAEVIAQVLRVTSVLLVPILAIVVLVRLLPQTAAAPASTPPALPVEAEAPTGRAPVWQPDRAAGAAWHSAGAAATGAAAVDWGRPGERGGWTAAGRPEGADPSGLPPSGLPPSGVQQSGLQQSGWRAPERAEGTPPRPPIDFGPRAQPAASPEQSPDWDVTRVAPDIRGREGTAAATGRPADAGPREIARRFSDNEDLTRPAPPGPRRQPPRWTPLEDPTQPPPKP